MLLLGSISPMNAIGTPWSRVGLNTVGDGPIRLLEVHLSVFGTTKPNGLCPGLSSDESLPGDSYLHRFGKTGVLHG